MAVYYLDISALVKRHALEKGTNWVFSLVLLLFLQMMSNFMLRL